jgi:hypothetical protein
LYQLGLRDWLRLLVAHESLIESRWIALGEVELWVHHWSDSDYVILFVHYELGGLSSGVCGSHFCSGF